MDKGYSLNNDGSFIIEDYNRNYPFSNFLPGVAGVWGIPMWVFYVNRGQGIISFGLDDKEHSMSEFLPANKAYALAPLVGFRTFIKVNGVGYEPFKAVTGENCKTRMVIRSSSLEIEESNFELGLQIKIKYFTLPNCSVAGLTRVVSIKNISDKNVNLEILDGHSRIIPFGTCDYFLKHMSRTIEAWIHSKIADNLAIFRLIVDPADVSETRYIEGANFNYAFYEDNGKKVAPYLIVDPDAIFGYDTTYASPVAFWNNNFKTPLEQITCVKTPCSFSHFNWQIAAGEEKNFYSIFGTALKGEIIDQFIKDLDGQSIVAKEKENEAITEGIKDNALCVSSSDKFNNYLKCSYLDNVLRGGYPYVVDKDSDVYYVFSRKHGDLERDYNRFKLLPSYFSEGEANYRDINQNRRMDLFFNPLIGKQNLVYFLNLIKIDGYNPLVAAGEKLFFTASEAKKILNKFKITNSKFNQLLVNGFHLGEFFKLAGQEDIKIKDREDVARVLVAKAKRMPHAYFGEGHWIDHWLYNLDLIESYLYFYPDKEEELYLSKDYVFWDDEFRVGERMGRYQLRHGKIYQGHSVKNEVKKQKIIHSRSNLRNFLRTKGGLIYKTNLVEKLLGIILNKVATLDPEGIGVEMEADKPGWCDSLNGLPAMLGSSLCETLEVKRVCLMLVDSLSKIKNKKIKSVSLSSEIVAFLKDLDKLLREFMASSNKAKLQTRDYLWWDKANLCKEQFRRKTFTAISGKQIDVKIEQIISFLTTLVDKLDIGINKAYIKDRNIYYTYFMYEVTKYSGKDKTIRPLKFMRKNLPLFLEGPVHALRIQKNKAMYAAIKKSELFDKEIKMYKLNASLESMPLEIGRSRVFVPGWLENESIWLHMEYKYLLEVLKNGLYDEFFEDFHNCGVCFFPPQKYGRNILENSSFIVSSAYPDKNLWGKGFVARLSGATAELLNIWVEMCLGKKPFLIDENKKLVMQFSPILKSDLFTQSKINFNFNNQEISLEENSLAFKLFSSILVVYHNPKRKDTYASDCKIVKIEVKDKQGNLHTFNSNIISHPVSESIRKTQVERIDIYFS